MVSYSKMCGGFTCSRYLLALLNILFMVVGMILIGVASYAKASAVITSMEIAGGVIASGLFLLLVALLGLVAGLKHHQVMLFFYIVILFFLFIIQFSVSIACLALSEAQLRNTMEDIWMNNRVSETVKHDAQLVFSCCAWERSEWNNTAPSSNETVFLQCGVHNYCVAGNNMAETTTMPCLSCSEIIPENVSGKLEVTGGIGLFFSFTEMLGVWLAVRFRNQKDPRANPNQFL